MSSSTNTLEIPFLEITDGEGELKTQNKPGQVQRPTITDRGRQTRFKVQATLYTCVHGCFNGAPATLIVLEYQLKCVDHHQCSFETVYTELKFREVASETNGRTAASLPNVKQIEPFSSSERWNITTEDVSSSSHVEGTAGVGVGPVTLSGTVGGQQGSAHEQKHFIEGDAGKHFNEDTQTYDQAWWNIKQNQNQEDGIPRNFRVAVLLERSNNADFEARFSLEVRAGFRYTASKVWEWCRGRANIDDPIVFRPTQPAQGDIKTIDDPSKLEDVDLAALCPVWGLRT